MAEGRSRAAWSHTSAVLALLANLHRNPKSRALSPGDFDPHAQRRRRTTTSPKVPLKDLKGLFLAMKPGGR